MNNLRLILAICGFALALLGVALNDVRLAWGAIAVLLGSLILRLVLGRRARGSPPPEG